MSKNVRQRFTTRLLFYWPGIAQAVVQTPLSLIPPNLQNILNQKWLKLGTWHFERRFIHLTPTVICHVSHVTCHISRVMCHVSHVTFFFFLFSGQFSEAYRWRVCYQRGLPRLVYFTYNSIYHILLTLFNHEVLTSYLVQIKTKKGRPRW